MLFIIFCVIMPFVLSYYLSPKCPGCGKRETMKIQNEIDNDTTELHFKCKVCGYRKIDLVKPVKGDTNRWINTQIGKLADKLGK